MIIYKVALMMGNGQAFVRSTMGIKSMEKITIATKNQDEQCFVNTGIDIVTLLVFFSSDGAITSVS